MIESEVYCTSSCTRIMSLAEARTNVKSVPDVACMLTRFGFSLLYAPIVGLCFSIYWVVTHLNGQKKDQTKIIAQIGPFVSASLVTYMVCLGTYTKQTYGFQLLRAAGNLCMGLHT
jgi:hypothetical protein